MKRLVLLIALASNAAIAAPTVAQLQQQKLDSASKTYGNVLVLWKGGRTTVENVYAWSVRWLDAELDKAPKKKAALLADHAKRMADLEVEAIKMRDAGTLTPVDAEAAVYFHAEADLWVLRGAKK